MASVWTVVHRWKFEEQQNDNIFSNTEYMSFATLEEAWGVPSLTMPTQSSPAPRSPVVARPQVPRSSAEDIEVITAECSDEVCLPGRVAEYAVNCNGDVLTDVKYCGTADCVVRD